MTPKAAFPAYSRCFKVFSRMIAHLPDSTWRSQDFPEKLTFSPPQDGVWPTPSDAAHDTWTVAITQLERLGR
jgi:hypothetical protein